MEKELRLLVLSALLHDIGKFAQRAKRPHSEGMEEVYLTTYKGRPSHWHTVYTDYFVETDLPLPIELEESRSLIARIASSHHRPNENSLPEMALTIADRLSAGIDRIEDEEEESKYGFRESRLLSIFDEIETVKHHFELPGKWFHHLVPLDSRNDGIFPTRGSPKGPEEDYEELFLQFLSELNRLNLKVPFSFFLDSLVSLLEKYTWCIPSSSYKTIPDISLFDHAFSTAGIAQALFLYHKHYNGIPRWHDRDKKFALLGGDLSGIQDYIFGIRRTTGRGLSKIFRARSFFLQALTQSIILEIQTRLGLFSVCRLMDSGGKFILLLPVGEPLLSKVEDLEEEVQFWFRREFKGQLTMNLSWSTQLNHGDFRLENFKSKIDEVNESLETSKHRKLKKTLSVSGPIIEEDFEENEGGNCTLCGINAADEISSRKYDEREGISIPICSACCSQIVHVGTQLPNTNYLIYGREGEVRLFSDVKLTLSESAPINFDGVILVEGLIEAPNFRRARFARRLPRLTKEELHDKRWLDLFQQEESDQYLRYDQPKTFNMIAHKSRKESPGTLIGRSLLGFIKADVDNLGFLISTGLGDRLSVARFSSFSRMLQFFFSDYLVQILQKEYPDIYVVFAGGDDLFLVGPWWQTIRFAITLRKRFSQFCSQNPDITLSAGIFIARPRIPIRRAADIVEWNLEQAKGGATPEQIKNSVRLLDATLSWPELESLIDLGEKFDKAVDDKERTNFTMAFLYRLLEYHRMYLKFTREKEIRFGRYLSHAYYDIGRNIQSRRRDNQSELDLLYDIFAVGVSERPVLDKLNIPLFYAINRNRGN